MSDSPELLKVRQFIYQTFPIAKKQQLSDTAELLDSGVIDSMGILEVVAFLEADLGVQVSDDDFLGDNFRTIESIAALATTRKVAS